MQFNRTLLNRLVAYLSRETHHRFRCFGCKRDVLVPDRFLEDARRNGCDHCGETLIPHDQSTGLCCPGCPAELYSQGTVCCDRQEDVYGYRCEYCGTESDWHFGAAPVPIRIERDLEDLEDPPPLTGIS
jgi:DNA-directed RNA polymerase subunit RPC12/RpoP